MKFNTDKCHSMRFTLRRNIIDGRYHLGNSALTSVDDYPYLGLTFTSNLSWSKHISGVTARANKILGLIRRNLRGCSRKLKEQAYMSLVRPHLEYTCPVWSPYHQNDINKIENIQRQAARFVLHRYRRQDSVSSMLQELQWVSLEQRRKTSSLILMYKICNNLVAVNPALYMTPMLPSSTRAYHPSKFSPLPARIQLFKASFFPRTVAWWNSLPVSTLSSPTYEVFRGAVTGST